MKVRLNSAALEEACPYHITRKNPAGAGPSESMAAPISLSPDSHNFSTFDQDNLLPEQGNSREGNGTAPNYITDKY